METIRSVKHVDVIVETDTDHNKPLAVVSVARLGGANVHQVVERLLSVSGEDTLTVDRKYREPWTGKLPTRFLLLSNELPRFGDASGVILRKMLMSLLVTACR